MTRLHLIFARASNGVIGAGGKLPWHLPEDLAHFKAKTLGHPVIMGRKTWDSLPARFRPLPGRTNVVLTRQPGWQVPGVLTATSLDSALALPALREADDIWVIGGADVYAQALPMAERVEVTEIDAAFVGDAHAPTLDATWQALAGPRQTAANGLGYRFVTFVKPSPPTH